MTSGMPWVGRVSAAGAETLKRVISALLFIALIDVLPIVQAGPSANSLAKGLIAVPVGIGLAFGMRYRNVVVPGLLAMLSALLIAFQASGYFQNDAACDIAIIALFVVGARVTVPLALAAVWPRGFTAAATLPFLGGRLPRSRTVRVSQTDRTRARNVGTIALLIAAVTLLITFAGHAGAGVTWRSAASLADAAAGGIAMYFIGERFGGRIAGLGSGVLWTCSAVRFDFQALPDPAFQPTALAPVFVAAALRLTASSKPRPLALAMVFAAAFVPLVYYWPLLALAAAVASAAALWADRHAVEAGWTCVAFIASAAVVFVAASATPLHALALQSAIDPAHAPSACASGCDGALPWEFFYPSAYGGVYTGLLTSLLARSLHWGNYQYYSISPGWAGLGLAAVGLISLRRSNVRLVRAACIAVACGLFLALPSHYLDAGLPSLVHIVAVFAPGFQFGSQSALCAALFVALLGGIGVRSVCAAVEPRVAALALLAASVAIALDCVSLPPDRTVAASFARATHDIAVPAGPIAFYPFLTDSYGTAYEELAAEASRRGFDLFNAHAGVAVGLADLSSPLTLPALRAAGVRLVIVSLDDYSRRQNIFLQSHVLLPADERSPGSSWRAPDATELATARILRTGADGVLLFALDPPAGATR